MDTPPAREERSEYAQFVVLEDLESLREEMEEIGVNNRDEVLAWLAAPAHARPGTTLPQADHVALHAILRLLEEYRVFTRAELDERISVLHAELDALGG